MSSKMEDVMDEAPDLIGPVIAYRAWRIADRFLTDGSTGEDMGPRLRSMHLGQSWEPGESMHAACIFQQHGMLLGGETVPHQAPGAGCRCGFYVMHTLDDLLDEPTQVARLRHQRAVQAVAGEVEVWGWSERYARGRRVEWCCVRALYSTPLSGDEDVDALAGAYGVPVLDDPDGKIEAWRQEKPEGSGRYWHAQGAGYRAGTITHTGHASYHSHNPPPQGVGVTVRVHAVMQDYVDAMQNAMRELAKATQLPTVFVRDRDEQEQGLSRDLDKPVANMRRDHLNLTADHRSPRSIKKKGVRNGRPR